MKYHERKAAGLCTKTGCRVGAAPGRALCQAHLDDHRRRNILYRGRKTGKSTWVTAMLEAQGGVCALCGGECSTFKGLVVDHDHESGKIRGLLCNNCNVGLGHFKDDVGLLNKAIEYLGRHQ